MTHELIVLAARWAHILAAITAVGGSIFIRFVLIPVSESVLEEDPRKRLRAAVTRRWQKFVHTCILLFLLSGFYNYLVILRPLHQGQALYHALFGIKVLLALAVFALATILTSSKDWSKAMRANARLWLGVLVALAVAVVMISGVLKNTPRTRPSIPAVEQTSK